MKKSALMILAFLLAAGCAKKEEPAESGGTGEAPSRLKYGTNGEAMVTLDKATQERIGLQTALVSGMQLNPQLKGFGRVVDPGPLAAAVADVVATEATENASDAELKRLQTLAAQDNASARALETAQANVARDHAQAEAARLKLLGNWGNAVAERANLPGLVESLGKLESALVRVDLPAGENLKSPPPHARIVPLGDEETSVEAELLGPVPTVDPQMQGQGFLYLVQPNTAKLRPGQAVIGYLSVPGDPLDGVLVPRSAVIRNQGVDWVYVNSDRTNFTRREIAPAASLEKGWFVTNGVARGDQVVTTGAQAVFSEELNGSGFMSGSRD